AGGQVLRAVHLVEIGDPHAPEALAVRFLGEDEAGLDLAVEAAHGGGGQDAFGSAAGAHHRVDARAHHGRGDAGGKVAVADEPNACTGLPDIGNEPLVPWPVEHDDHEVVHLALERLGDGLEVVLHGRLDVDVAL